MGSGIFYTSIAGTQSSSPGAGYPNRIKVAWEEYDINVASNTSKIRVNLYSDSAWNANGTKFTYLYSINLGTIINGNTNWVWSWSGKLQIKHGNLIADGSYGSYTWTSGAISHNNDGSKSIGIVVSAAIYAYAANVSGSQTISLTTIPRKSIVHIRQQEAHFGDKIEVYFDQVPGGLTNRVWWEFLGHSGEVYNGGASSGIYFTIPSSWSTLVPAGSDRANITMHSETYSGNSCIGTDSSTRPVYLRGATVTMSTPPYIGGTVTFSVSKPNSNMSIDLTFIGVVNGTKYRYTVTGQTGSTSFNWTIPAELANYIPSSTSTGCIIVWTSYMGSTVVGSSSGIYTIYVPDWMKPNITKLAWGEVSRTFTDGTTNTCVSKLGNLVQNESKINCSGSAAGSYSSSITNIQLSVNGSTYSSNSDSISITTDYLRYSGTNNLTITATDTRGRQASKTIQFGVASYSPPSIIAHYGNRCLSDGTANDAGEYCYVYIAWKITDINGKNAHNFNNIKDTFNGGNWDNWWTGSVANYNGTSSNITPESGNYSWNNWFQISDSFHKVQTHFAISTAFCLVDFDSNGQGIGIGKVSEGNKWLDCKLPIVSRDSLCAANDVITKWGSENRSMNNLHDSIQSIYNSLLDSPLGYTKWKRSVSEDIIFKIQIPNIAYRSWHVVVWLRYSPSPIYISVSTDGDAKLQAPVITDTSRIGFRSITNDRLYIFECAYDWESAWVGVINNATIWEEQATVYSIS